MNEFFKNKWTIPVLLGLILLIGTFLRVPELYKTDLWYDEAFTGITVRQSWKGMMDVIVQDRNHPPIYYSLVKLVADTTLNTPFTLRLVSFVSGLAAIPMLFLLVQQLTSLTDIGRKKFGLVAAFVIAISPFYVTYSGEARSYAFLFLLMLGSLYFFLKTIKTPYKFTSYLAVWLVSIVVIFFTHYLSILVVSGYVVAYLFIILQDNKILNKPAFWVNATWVSLLGFLSVVLLWDRLGLKELLAKRNLGWIPEANLSVIPRTIASFLFGVDRQAFGLPPTNQLSFPISTENIGFLFLISAVVVLVLAYQKTTSSEKKRELLVLSAIGIVPLSLDILVSTLGLFTYVDRYVFGYGTFFLLLCGYAWWSVVGEEIWRGLALYVVLLAFVAIPNHGKPYTTIITAIPKDSVIEQTVVIDSPLDFLVFKYYLQFEPVYVKTNPAGYSYDWPYIPPATEKSLATLHSGDYYVARNNVSVNTTDWQLAQQTKDFALYTRK